MGRGYVFAGELRWKEARIEFEKVIELEQAKNPQVEAKDGGMETSHTAFALEALEQRGWCLIQEGDLEAGKTVLQEVAVVLDAQPARNQDSARIWWRIGMAEWQLGGE
jgi:superkiller protein 3